MRQIFRPVRTARQIGDETGRQQTGRGCETGRGFETGGQNGICCVTVYAARQLKPFTQLNIEERL